jgi:hypothetical protein
LKEKNEENLLGKGTNKSKNLGKNHEREEDFERGKAKL